MNVRINTATLARIARNSIINKGAEKLKGHMNARKVRCPKSSYDSLPAMIIFPVVISISTNRSAGNAHVVLPKQDSLCIRDFL